MDRKELEDRLIAFSNNVLLVCREARFDLLTLHLARQVVRKNFGKHMLHLHLFKAR
jgi:hypothetical protein